MNLFTFKRGIFPSHNKHLTEDKPIENLLPKGNLVFYMSQHIGAPCEPLVKKGERVLVGQKLGEAKGFVSSPVHSSVSGVVKDICPMLHPNGTKVISVIVENDGLYEELSGLKPRKDYKKLSKEELLKIIQEAGIVGMGGAGFPTHVKLSPPPGKKIDFIIVNGAECEPYLTCDHRLMLESTKEIVEGLKIILQIFPGVKGYIGIESNKPNAVQAMREAIKGISNIEVAVLKTKYPQGAEKQLIYAVTGREVPSGKLPADAGCIVQNVGTVFEIYNAVANGRPLIERIVTVTGEALKEPKNLRIKLGTSFREIIEACGDFKEDPIKIISGGPLMGTAISTLDLYSMKGTSGVLCLTREQAVLPEQDSCIRCGRCIEACPMNLIPTNLDSLVNRRLYDDFAANNGMDCIECGCCTVVCPAKRHLTQSCREGKRSVIANRKKAN